MQTLPSLEDATMAARLLFSLPFFLRHSITRGEARATLHNRLQHRQASFLGLMRRAVYEHPASPYLQLLRLAGCEYGDLARLVGQEGLEGTTRTLFHHGVYLTQDELKGRRPARRGSSEIAVRPDRLRNPCLAYHVPVRSGGSRNIATPVLMDLVSIRDHAINEFLTLDARGGIGWMPSIWKVPGGSAMRLLLRYAVCGVPQIRWFSQVDPAAAGLHPRYRWSARVMCWAGLLARMPLPRPKHVALQNPLPIADWIAGVLSAGGTPLVDTFASSAVRLCQTALEAGINLRGAQFTLTGEPTTQARLAVIRNAGAEAVPSYAAMEAGGRLAYGCLAPEATDDLHFFHDLHSLIQPGREEHPSGLPSDALLISSLLGTSPLILLNVSLGDQAVVARRACGCPLEQQGWTTHIYGVRSYEKLTAAGMTFLDTDVVHVLEDVLPSRFGGVPTSYQLLEQELDDGRPALGLLVDPNVGPINHNEVADAFLEAVGGGQGLQRIMELQWRDAGLLRVERRSPSVTHNGKILHLHTGQGARTKGASRDRA
jgi:hypothetical protein